MKTEKATIKLVLRTNKTLADGTHPIMLRVNWRGQRAEKSSGFSCKEVNWSAASECLKVKGRDAISNAETINIIIQEEKHKAENILNTFIMEKKSYTAQMIVDYLKDEGRSVKYTKDLNNLVAEYINVHRLKEETIQSINGIVKHFKAYMGKDNIYLADVSKATAVGFGRWCAEQEFKNNTIRTHIQKMRALYRYAVDAEIIKDNPFLGINETKMYKAENNKQALTKEALDLFRYFYAFRNSSWCKGKVEDKFFVVGHKIFACNIFFICYAFQGLALIDLAKLRSDNFVLARISDKANRYLEVHTKRSKTRKDVPIAVRFDEFHAFLIMPYLEYMKDNDFFLPILRKSDDTDKKVLVRMRYATTTINKNLKEVWKEYNMWLRGLVDKYSDKPLPKKMGKGGYFDHKLVISRKINHDTIAKFIIDERTTLYSARHTFATIFINSEGAKTAELAQLMGRNVSGIDRYIKELMSIEDVLKARDKMK